MSKSSSSVHQCLVAIPAIQTAEVDLSCTARHFIPEVHILASVVDLLHCGDMTSPGFQCSRRQLLLILCNVISPIRVSCSPVTFSKLVLPIISIYKILQASLIHFPKYDRSRVSWVFRAELHQKKFLMTTSLAIFTRASRKYIEAEGEQV
jgi:hypothetical protein